MNLVILFPLVILSLTLAFDPKRGASLVDDSSSLQEPCHCEEFPSYEEPSVDDTETIDLSVDSIDARAEQEEIKLQRKYRKDPVTDSWTLRPKRSNKGLYGL